MLQNIGDKLKGEGGAGRSSVSRWVWYTILGALILVFAAWGPYSAVDLTINTTGYAAKVNGEKISADEINQTWQQQQPQLLQAFGGTLTDAQRQQFQQRLLDNAVRSLAATQYARKMGFRVSDEQVKQAFQGEQAFQVDGKFNAQTALARLAAAGITPESFEADLRRSLLSNQLLGTIGATDFMTSAESRRVLALLDEERELRFVLLQPDPFLSALAVDPAAVDAYYKGHAAEFTLPESVQLAYAELSLADIAAQLPVDEAQLRARYEKDRASYQRAESRRARHILIPVDGSTDDARASALARDLYAKLKGGADFAQLAKQFSKDSASAAKGGDLDWAGRETYVKEFADRLFSMKDGELAEPVKTQFGYHIIRLDGIRAAAGRSFDEVRSELEAALRNELAVAQFGTRQDQLQERLERGGANLDQLAQEFGLRKGEVARFERGAGGLPLGSDADLNHAVFADASLNQHRVGGPVPLGEDRVTIFQVMGHQAAALQPLATVRDGIVTALQRERATVAALAAAEAAVKRLQGGETFDTVAAALKVKADPARFVARGAPDLPVALRDAAFAGTRPQTGKGQYQALKIDGGAVAILAVTGSRVPALSDNPQLQQLRTQRELQRYSQRDIQAYLVGIVKAAKVTTNPQVFQ
jgi:peptidyl-prolyl cis-trans isomerase D